MNMRMPVGVDDFAKARREYYMVDKTDMIRRLIDDHAEVTLFTRPRRFGKTMAMSMLDYFFSIEKKEETAHLFDGMAIDRAGERYMAERGRYPVIFMTLKGVQNDTMPLLFESFQYLLQQEFEKHAYLLDKEILTEQEKVFYRKILSQSGSMADCQVSLLELCKYMKRYYGTAPIVLLDEYDAPIQCAYDHGFYEKAISYFRTWYNNTLKGNPWLSFAVLTGVLRIAKESIFSGLNNLKVCSVTTESYNDSFGFTPEEVEQLARDKGLSSRIGEIRSWYDGYHFGSQEIYNPWSVVCFFDEGELGDYWIHTSGNAILQKLLPAAGTAEEENLLSLMRGGPVSVVLQESLIYNDIENHPDALYTLLLTTGYLTCMKKSRTFGGLLCDLAIPNREVGDAFRVEILNHLRRRMPLSRLVLLMEHLLHGEGEAFSRLLSEYTKELVSAYDGGNKESFYHGFLLGMTALLVPDYTVESNRESGYGRFDLAIFPKEAGKAGVLMEFKAAEKEGDLPKKAEEALRQIREKEYDAAFRARGIEKVWKYGIAFCGKNVEMKWER